VRFYEASWFTSAAACQVARPCADLTRVSPSHRDFYFQASVESVTLLGAGYNYDSHWIVLSMVLSPLGLTSSLAARPRNFMKEVQRSAMAQSLCQVLCFQVDRDCRHSSFDSG
jgi:hypothetical protein